MSRGMDERFRDVVATASSRWLVVGPGDPNTVDLWWVARGIEHQLSATLPTNLPDVGLGVALIDECVERRLICGLIRSMDREELVTRSWDTVECARAKGFALPSALLTLAALLHAWTGCIGMAKALRRETSAMRSMSSIDGPSAVYA